ncbi:MAG: heavy metal-associated domain-containing protein [Betaproteobacteria bacterium]
METVNLNVDGMTCGGCVASVTRVLKATPGVSDAVVELAAKRATVTFDPAQTSVPALKAAVGDAGYAAS